MYVKSTRTSAKREFQKERSAKRDDQIARDENVLAKRADFFNTLLVLVWSGKID